MKKVKVYLDSRYQTDGQYKRFIELLMEISGLEEWEIIDRKDSWEEYEIFENRQYVIECKLSNKEIEEALKNRFKIEMVLEQ